MNRLLRLLLLISFGLNLGLGWVVIRDLREDGPGPVPAMRAGRERPAPGDTAAWRRMMHHRIERLSSLLDLTPDQAAELQRLQLANGPRVRAQHERIEAARARVRGSADAGSFDPAAVREALRDLRHAQADFDSLTQEFLMAEFALMDAGQRARYLEILPLDPWRGGRPAGPDGEPGRSGGRRRRVE